MNDEHLPATGHPERSARTRAGLTLAALLVVACGINVAHMLRYTELSPIDEAQHLDSLIRIPRGDLIGSGERMGQETLRIQTCQRIDSPFDEAVPPCQPADGPYLDPATFQEEGYNTAFIHPPTYYMVGGVLARGIDVVLPGDHDLLTTGRLAGLTWVVGSVVFLWLLLAELGAGLLGRSSLILLAVTAPTVLHASATINPDGTALLTGAALLWATLRWERGRMTTWVPLALVGLAAAIKVTNLVGVAVVVAYLVVRAVNSTDEEGLRSTRFGLKERFWQPESRARRLLTMAGGLVVVVGVVSFGWFVAQRVLQEAPPSTIPMVSRYEITSFPLVEMASSWSQTVSPLQTPYLPDILQTDGVMAMAAIVAMLIVVGAVAGTILAVRGSRERSLGVCALVLLPLLGPLLVLFNAIVQGLYVVIPSRYGLALIPALLAAAVPALRYRTSLVVAGSAAVLAVGSLALALVAAPPA
ncbi:hypothetical protein [Rhabdothermincola salaria]|uniref:hypothetical protein n=1 Tax=Rhabdothermincola salaria TaxID=2903142 RepID=UPI001E2E9115|nr:hypothetical protein [Rhabdothermincola salaria]MCD9623367.1 hypothetical protein [Rhabdothermincola salaria]